MTSTLLEWQRKHGIAADALADLVAIVGLDAPRSTKETPEARVQDEAVTGKSDGVAIIPQQFRLSQGRNRATCTIRHLQRFTCDEQAYQVQ